MKKSLYLLNILTFFIVLKSISGILITFGNENESEPCRLLKCNCQHVERKHPVCGSDNRTYWNECELNCQKKNCKKDVVIARNGTCEVRSVGRCCQFKCPIEDLNFICGTDGVTYGNECEFKCEAKCKLGLGFKRCGHCKYGLKNKDCLPPAAIKFLGSSSLDSIIR